MRRYRGRRGVDPCTAKAVQVPGVPLFGTDDCLAKETTGDEVGYLGDGCTAATVRLPGQELIGHAPVALGIQAVRQLSGNEEGVAVELWSVPNGCDDSASHDA